MPLTLEQYASYLDTRDDLPWPAPPEVEVPKAKPHAKRLSDVRAVLWNVYGTLVSLPGGQLYFTHPTELMMKVSLKKTLQEFKMWQSMSRKPGQPEEYLRSLYSQELTKQQGISVGGEKHPEMASDKLWEALVKKLLQKEYSWDTGFYGALNELSQKIAWFFHASLQGYACYPKVAATMEKLHNKGIQQGLLADGQCFTTVQLQRGLHQQEEKAELSKWIPENQIFLSYQYKARKPSDTLFHTAVDALLDKGFEKHEILHVGSRLEEDIAPARQLGLKTALFAGDKASLKATPDQMKNERMRPDVMITEIRHIAEMVG